VKYMRKKLFSGFTALKIPILVLLISIGAIFFVWQRAYTLSLSRKVAFNENRLSELRAQNSEKNIQLSQLSSPERIESLAKEMCNLRYSSPDERILVYEKSKKIIPETRWQQSFFAIKGYVVEKWESFANSQKQRWRINNGNL